MVIDAEDRAAVLGKGQRVLSIFAQRLPHGHTLVVAGDTQAKPIGENSFCGPFHGTFHYGHAVQGSNLCGNILYGGDDAPSICSNEPMTSRACVLMPWRGLLCLPSLNCTGHYSPRKKLLFQLTCCSNHIGLMVLGSTSWTPMPMEGESWQQRRWALML